MHRYTRKADGHSRSSTRSEDSDHVNRPELSRVGSMKVTTRKLADICTMRTGKLNSNAARLNGMFPFFTCAQETYRIDKVAFNTEAVLLGGNNANGVFPLKYYNGEFNAYQRTYVIETLDSSVLDTRYLFYALQPALSKFQAASIGAATQYLTKETLIKSS